MVDLRPDIVLAPLLDWTEHDRSRSTLLQMVPFAGYELPVLYDTEWGGIVKGEWVCLAPAGRKRMVLALCCHACAVMLPHAPPNHHILSHKTTNRTEHLHCRAKASVFDVSHMGQIKCVPTVCNVVEPASFLSGSHHHPTPKSHPPASTRWFGKDRVKFLETLVVGDIAGLATGEARLSLLTNKDGGIIDDTIITNAGDYT